MAEKITPGLQKPYVAVRGFAHRIEPTTNQIESCELTEKGNPNHKWRLITAQDMEMISADKHELRIILQRIQREFPHGYVLPKAHSLREL